MKYVAHAVTVSCAALFLLLASRAHAQDPEADFDGFRIPEHRWQTLSASLAGSFSPRSESGPGQTTRDENLRGNLGSGFAMERDADLLQHFLQANVSVNGSRTASQSASATSTTDAQVDSRLRALSENWTLSGEVRWYQEARPVGLALSASAGGRHLQSWYRVSSWESMPASGSWEARHGKETRHDSWYDEAVAVTLGYGRVRDATGIYDAYVLERRLKEAGVLARSLSPAARRQIAALFYERQAFGRVHDRPDRYFWREVEQALVDDGAIQGSLDAYAAMRVNERFGPVTQVVRKTGFFTGPVIQGAFTQRRMSAATINRLEGVQSGVPFLNVSDADAGADLDNENLFVGAGIEFHRPVGVRWQVDASHTVLVPVLHVKKGLSVRTAGQLRYLVADRWQAQASVSQGRTYLQPDPGRSGADDQWFVIWSAGVDYYVEDQVKVGLSIQDTQLDARVVEYHSRGTQIALTVTYSFISRLEIVDLGATPPLR